MVVLPKILGLNLEEIEMLFMTKEARYEKEQKMKKQHLKNDYQNAEDKLKF